MRILLVAAGFPCLKGSVAPSDGFMPVYPGDLMMAWALGSVRCGNQETLAGLCESADMVGGNAALWVFGFAGLGEPPPLVAC